MLTTQLIAHTHTHTSTVNSDDDNDQTHFSPPSFIIIFIFSSFPFPLIRRCTTLSLSSSNSHFGLLLVPSTLFPFPLFIPVHPCFIPVSIVFIHLHPPLLECPTLKQFLFLDHSFIVANAHNYFLVFPVPLLNFCSSWPFRFLSHFELWLNFSIVFPSLSLLFVSKLLVCTFA